MEISLIHCIAALFASVAAVATIAADRFRNPIAASLAVAGGFAPWLFIAMETNVLPFHQPLGLYGLGGSGPTFLLAGVFHLGGDTPKGRKASIICFIGMVAGFAFNFFTFASMMSGFR